MTYDVYYFDVIYCANHLIIFLLTPIFFIIRTCLGHWPLTNGLKYFLFLYCRESCEFSRSYTKGHSNKIFDLQFFFIIRTCLGHWLIQLKYLQFRKISPVNQMFRKNLPKVSYCAESISLQYRTAGSQSPPVSYCGESVMTPGIS